MDLRWFWGILLVPASCRAFLRLELVVKARLRFFIRDKHGLAQLRERLDRILAVGPHWTATLIAAELAEQLVCLGAELDARKWALLSLPRVESELALGAILIFIVAEVPARIRLVAYTDGQAHH